MFLSHMMLTTSSKSKLLAKVFYRTNYTAFSLIEVLLSFAIGMVLMVAATFYLYSITQAYEQLKQEPSFEEHVDHLLGLLETWVGPVVQFPVTVAKEDEQPSPQVESQKMNKPRRKGKGHIRWEVPPGGVNTQDYLLAFDLQRETSFLELLPGATPHFTGYLYVEPSKGLFLIYQTIYQKKDNPQKAYIYLLSPYVKSLSYRYYDAQQQIWSTQERMPVQASDQNPQIPHVLVLTFQQGDEDIQREILIAES